jgi:hypothetical protein
MRGWFTAAALMTAIAIRSDAGAVPASSTKCTPRGGSCRTSPQCSGISCGLKMVRARRCASDGAETGSTGEGWSREESRHRKGQRQCAHDRRSPHRGLKHTELAGALGNRSAGTEHRSGMPRELDAMMQDIAGARRAEMMSAPPPIAMGDQVRVCDGWRAAAKIEAEQHQRELAAKHYVPARTALRGAPWEDVQ